MAKPKPSTGGDVIEFAKRCRSILWRQDGKVKKSYNEWLARATELESKEGGAYTKNEALVRAAKEYPCLHRLFREYDLHEFDPNPESHPNIQYFGQKDTEESPEITCDGLEQSYRDSLRWAIDAAGAYLRTSSYPVSCPCDAAWYLFKQAIADPKDFLAKVGQVESRGDSDSDERKNLRRSGQRSVAEIESMLEELCEEPK